MKHYVTFGQSHVHSVNGRTFDKDSVAVYEAADAQEGRTKAFEYFGDKFMTDYHGEQFDETTLHYFPRGYVYVDQASVQLEYILCAANYYEDGNKHPHPPKNKTTGFVICGRRHHNIINTLADALGFLEESVQYDIVQGFMTNLDRFVDRQEAYALAFASNQIIGPNKGYPTNSIGLTSEDLY